MPRYDASRYDRPPLLPSSASVNPPAARWSATFRC
jgi:hypothetical protein